MTSLTLEHLLEVERELRFKYPPQYNLQIFYDVNIYEMEQIEKTWKERLWSWPWKPWQKYKLLPKPMMYRVGSKIFAHPAFKAELEERIRNGERL